MTRSFRLPAVTVLAVVLALLIASTVTPRVHAPTVIAFDAATSNSCTPCVATTLSWSHTVGSGSNRILVVGVAMNGPSSVTGVTYGASSLDLYVKSFLGDRAWMYVLSNPPVGAAMVTVTFASAFAGSAGAGSVSYFNVQGVGSFNPSDGSGSLASNTVGSGWGNGIVVDLLRAGSNAAPLSAGAGQTLRWQEPTVGAMSDKITTTPTTTMTWTLAGGGYGGSWDVLCIGLLPVTVTSTTTTVLGSPVGGFVESVNKVGVLLPWLTILGCITAIAIVVWKKREN